MVLLSCAGTAMVSVAAKASKVRYFIETIAITRSEAYSELDWEDRTYDGGYGEAAQ